MSSSRRTYQIVVGEIEFQSYQRYLTLPDDTQAICRRFVDECVRAQRSAGSLPEASLRPAYALPAGGLDTLQSVLALWGLGVNLIAP